MHLQCTLWEKLRCTIQCYSYLSYSIFVLQNLFTFPNWTCVFCNQHYSIFLATIPLPISSVSLSSTFLRVHIQGRLCSISLAIQTLFHLLVWPCLSSFLIYHCTVAWPVRPPLSKPILAWWWVLYMWITTLVILISKFSTLGIWEFDWNISWQSLLYLIYFLTAFVMSYNVFFLSYSFPYSNFSHINPLSLSTQLCVLLFKNSSGSVCTAYIFLGV